MPQKNEPTVDHENVVTDMTLSDYVERAAAADIVEERDGSTVVYLHLRRLERFSTLPRPKWQGWFSRALGNKPTAPATDSLGESVNVRRVPRDPQN